MQKICGDSGNGDVTFGHISGWRGDIGGIQAGISGRQDFIG
ncbi:hypothetical protein [Salibacterium halotolerans]|nr:hypothetical protein [Salibacterium halotolerans]